MCKSASSSSLPIPFTFNRDLNRNAAPWGPKIEFAVSSTQSQSGAAGVPLKATYSQCLLQHGLQAHLLHIPHPHSSGHVVYRDRHADTPSQTVSSYGAVKYQDCSSQKVDVYDQKCNAFYTTLWAYSEFILTIFGGKIATV